MKTASKMHNWSKRCRSDAKNETEASSKRQKHLYCFKDAEKMQKMKHKLHKRCKIIYIVLKMQKWGKKYSKLIQKIKKF